MSEAREAFCAHLKAAREKRGISLAQIADSTKIGVSLFKGLESNNLSRWPKGLYRRSCLRDYLKGVGLPVESTVAEFVRLFPDEEDAPLVQTTAGEKTPAPPLIPQTAGDGEAPGRQLAHGRVLAAVLDVAAVLAFSGVIAWIIHASAWATATVVGFSYYSVGTACLGGSVGLQWIRRRWVANRMSAKPELPAVTPHVDSPRGPSQRTRSSRRRRRRSPNAPVVRIRLVR